MDDVDDIFGLVSIDEFVEETDRDIAMDEERAEEFLPNFAPESIEAGRPTTVEEALNMPIAEIDEIVSDEGYLEVMLEDSFEAYVRTALFNVIEDIHGTMKARKEIG